MGKFQAMHKYFAVFLVLVAFHYSLLTHARKIKPLNTDTTLPPLKTSVNVPGTPSSEKNVDSPIIPKYGVASFGESSDTNAFRPTTPGSSPGVGHRKFAGEDEDMEVMVAVVQSPDVKVYVTKGIAPTTPGHSPGVGHGAHLNKTGKIN